MKSPLLYFPVVPYVVLCEMFLILISWGVTIQMKATKTYLDDFCYRMLLSDRILECHYIFFPRFVYLSSCLYGNLEGMCHVDLVLFLLQCCWLWTPRDSGSLTVFSPPPPPPPPKLLWPPCLSWIREHAMGSCQHSYENLKKLKLRTVFTTDLQQFKKPNNFFLLTET